jgi:membrane associated rhomboid family serine protease
MRYRSNQRFADVTVLAIIAINVVLFVARVARPTLIDTLGLTPSSWTSEPWTLLTSMFMHADITHILFNMLSLYFLGRFLCQLVGDKWFLVVYFAGGIIGNFFFILLSIPLDTEYTTVIGASGAIFAVGGALAILVPNVKVILFPIPTPIPLWTAIIGTFLLLTLIAFVSDIAWEAHLGGLLLGLAVGYYLRRRQRGVSLWQRGFLR